MAAVRTPFVGGNWKMNGTRASVKALLDVFNGASITSPAEVVLGVPALLVDYVKAHLTLSWQLALQNTYKEASGAFTGEISPAQALDSGVNWVILGHSERRCVFGETNALVGQKVGHALSAGVSVVACVGEQLAQREAGATQAVVDEQLASIAQYVSDWTKVVVAYEPVWAIGTGKVATPAQAQEVHAAIRAWLAKTVSAEIAASTRIIYGGSVKANNCVELGAQADIDGFLVGGASLEPGFISIVNAFSK